MARCGCGTTCACVVNAGNGIAVSGAGSAASPIVVANRLSVDAGQQAIFGTDGGLLVPQAGVASGTSVAGLPTGAGAVLGAYRGGRAMWPENSPGCWQQAAEAGSHIVHLDVWSLQDGALVLMADSTLDRTTTATGNTRDQQASSWKRLTIDGSSWWYFNTLDWVGAPFLEDCFADLGRSIVYLVELHNTEAGGLISGLVKRFGLQSNVIVAAPNISWLSAAQAAGLATCLVIPDATAASANPVAGVYAAGVRWVMIHRQIADATIATYIAQAGMNVLLYPVVRHNHRARVVTLGARGGVADDPWYYDGPRSGYAYRRTRQPAMDYTATSGPNIAMPHVGQINQLTDNGSYVSDTTIRGNFGGWGSNWDYVAFGPGSGTERWSLCGWGCPVANPAGSYNIRYSITFESSGNNGSWIGMGFCCTDDQVGSGGGPYNGYSVQHLIQGGGGLYKYTNGTPTFLFALPAVGAYTVGTEYTYEIRVTPANFTIVNISGMAQSNTMNTETSYRGGYFMLGKGEASTFFSAHRKIQIL